MSGRAAMALLRERCEYGLASMAARSLAAAEDGGVTTGSVTMFLFL
jgi:hypothetical protein